MRISKDDITNKILNTTVKSSHVTIPKNPVFGFPICSIAISNETSSPTVAIIGARFLIFLLYTETRIINAAARSAISGAMMLKSIDAAVVSIISD